MEQGEIGTGRIAGCSDQELRELCGRLRQEIIDVVSRQGGHLAPSLGAIEIVVALHAVFQSPEDRMIFDVGHQAYGHKLLTGRREIFQNLRQKGGASGYLRRSESPHDHFGAGHASTAISAALGLAKARDLQGATHAVVAVVGDGALTGGLAYEGLNNAGQLGSDLIIVLNDNSMSISPNVGAVSRYLTRLRSAPAFLRFKHDVEAALRAIPLVGRGAAEAAERMKDSVKHLLVAGQLFEELGVRYLGPIDGHDVATLRTVLRHARDLGGPVLVHAVTEKGHGYEPAARDANKWHSTAPFEVETGQGRSQKKGGQSWSDVFGQIAVDLAKENPKVIAITAAMADGTGLVRFRETHPDRFFDVGIAEAHAVAFAAGLAADGQRPICAIYSTFLQRAYDQVVHDVAIQSLPVRFAMDRAGLVGADGQTHAGAFDLAYLGCLPGMVIMAPSDEAELMHAVATSIAIDDGPSALRYPRGEGFGVELPEQGVPWEIGRGRVVREGSRVAILALGTRLHEALKAADELAAHGYPATVADARFAKPLDTALVSRLAANHEVLITIEEAAAGGFGAAVAQHLAWTGAFDHGLKFRPMSLPDRFIDHNTPAAQLIEAGLTAKDIVAHALSAFGVAETGRDAVAIPAQ